MATKTASIGSLPEIVSKVELLSVRPYSIIARRGREPRNEWKTRMGTHLAERIDYETFECHFHAMLTDTEERSDDEVLISLSLKLSYKLPSLSDLSDDDLKPFISTTVPVNAWPYWREVVQSSASRLQINVPLVGVRRFRADAPTKSAPTKPKAPRPPEPKRDGLGC